MFTPLILIAVLLFLAVCGLVEFRRHQRRVRSIPIRIHVNGTRGKSSVTRLIGAGLRAGGIRTITKVTGTYPRLILEDGSDVHIHRRSEANIIEQLSVVRLAAERKAEALVVECMALQRQFQRIVEHQMIHATVGVITNVRLDHIDIMGKTLPEIGDVLAETIPNGRHLFVDEQSVVGLLDDHARKRGTALVGTSGDSVSEAEAHGFSYIEHRENIALALAVCQHLGVDRDTALQGMYAATPDAGVLRRFVIDAHGKRITFYNAFAANDPQSSLHVWKRLKHEHGLDGTRIILLNTRQDRMDRARQLAELVGRHLNQETDFLVLIGECPEVVRSMAMRNGMDPTKVIPVGWTTPESVLAHIMDITERISSVVAIGNMGGMGGMTADYFEHRSMDTHDRVGHYAGAGAEPLVV